MELYQKKRYLINQPNKKRSIKYEKNNNDLNKNENTFFHKMIEQNKLSDENTKKLININIKNILSNENNLKKAIKYVSEYNRNNSVERRNYRNIEKSASPLGLNQRFKYNELNQSTTPIRRVLNLTRDLKYNTNVNKSKDYEIEISSINENGMPKSKSKEKEKKEEKNNLRENNDDDINELISTIEDLQSIINGQKYEIKNL